MLHLSDNVNKSILASTFQFWDQEASNRKETTGNCNEHNGIVLLNEGIVAVTNSMLHILFHVSYLKSGLFLELNKNITF